MLCKLLSNIQNSGVLPMLCESEMQNTASYGLLRRELTPSQPDPGQVLVTFSCCCSKSHQESRGTPVLEDVPREEPDVFGDGISLHQPTNQLKVHNTFDWCLSGREASCDSPRSPLFSSRMNCNSTRVCILSAFKIHAIKHYSLMDPGGVPLLGEHAEEAGREAQCRGVGRSPAPGTASQVGLTQRRRGQHQEWLYCRGVARRAAPGTAPEVR